MSDLGQGDPSRLRSLPRDPRFPAGHRIDATFDDLEEMAAAGTNWDHVFRQLGRGAFRGRIVAGHTASVQMGVEQWSPGILIRGDGPPRSVALAAALGEGPRPHFCGRVLREDELAVLFPGEEIDFQLAQRGAIAVAVFDEELLDQYCRAVWGFPLADRCAEGRLRIAHPGHQGGLRAKVAECLRLAQAHPATLLDPQASRLLEQELLEALAPESRPPRRSAASSQRARAVQRAEDYAMAHVDRPVTVAELCAECRVTQRTLQLGFRQRFGLSPKAFLQSIRLDAVRKRLLRPRPGDNVQAIAHAWGFFHAGRFAADYRRQFGQSPSETLRRGWERALFG